MLLASKLKVAIHRPEEELLGGFDIVCSPRLLSSSMTFFHSRNWSNTTQSKSLLIGQETFRKRELETIISTDVMGAYDPVSHSWPLQLPLQAQLCAVDLNLGHWSISIEHCRRLDLVGLLISEYCLLDSGEVNDLDVLSLETHLLRLGPRFFLPGPTFTT